MRRTAVWWLAAAIFLLQGLRLRNHASQLRRVETGNAETEPGRRPARHWHWLLADRVVVPDSVRRVLELYAEAEGLDVLDVIPRDLPVEQAVQLLTWDSPAGYRRRRLAQPITALQAILADDATLERSGLREIALEGNHDPIVMQRLANELVRAATTSKDLVAAGGVAAAAEDPSRRRAYLRSRLGPLSGFALLFSVLRLVFLGSGLILSPVAGSAALLPWCLQPVLAFVGTPLRPRDLWWRSSLRWLLAPISLVRVFSGRWAPAPGADGQVDPESLRPVYAELLAGGTEPFFEERRPDCPMCGCRELRVMVHSLDLTQRKPGRFILERCGDCRHVFQNPRLSLDGLDFYYRDSYDGLNRELMFAIFASSDTAYRSRASMLDGLAQPSRWLDVGAGHGHFCLAASEHWPETHFDGLDMSTSIDEAASRGWIETGYRGQLPDLAAELKGRYDVVSMFHYLEHTRDPLREIDAARTLLPPGGYLLVEVPDPDCLWGGILRQYWFPWLQPQHQNLMPFENLRAALMDRGFEVVRSDRGAATQPINVVAAVALLLLRFAPPPGHPWRPNDGPLERARFQIALTLAAPFMSLGIIVDRATLPLFQRGRRSNAYRVLARVPTATYEDIGPERMVGAGSCRARRPSRTAPPFSVPVGGSGPSARTRTAAQRLRANLIS